MVNTDIKKVITHGEGKDKEEYELDTEIAILIESIKELTKAMNKLRTSK